MSDPETLTLFYSWQSDLPQSPTTKVIRRALRSAINELESRHDVQIILDEATKRVSGAPNIPFEIAQKIERADIFVGDITTVAQSNVGKSLPNPNVTFELGLGVAHLGWYRTILLFNEGLQAFENLPFDFDRHRISKFDMRDEPTHIRANEPALKNLLVTAIEQIILDKPKRPAELKGKSEPGIRRERDLTNIRWFMRQINTALLDQHCEEMPDRLHYFAGVMKDNLDSVVSRSDFLLNDVELKKIMLEIHKRLDETLKYDRYYRQLSTVWMQAFGAGRTGPSISHSEELEVAQKITRAASKLRSAVGKLLAKIHADYLEIDVDETNREFAKAYKKIKDGED